MQGDKEKCLAAGMNDYLTKPISQQQLADALGRWLPVEQSEEEWSGGEGEVEAA